jgi:hypothetical protein
MYVSLVPPVLGRASFTYMFPICITDVGLEGKYNDVGDAHLEDSG